MTRKEAALIADYIYKQLEKNKKDRNCYFQGECYLTTSFSNIANELNLPADEVERYLMMLEEERMMEITPIPMFVGRSNELRRQIRFADRFDYVKGCAYMPQVSLDKEYIKEYGFEAAFIIKVIQDKINEGKNEYGFECWAVFTAEQFINENNFFGGKAKFRFHIKKLLNEGVLIMGCHNENKADRTSWYKFTREFKNK